MDLHWLKVMDKTSQIKYGDFACLKFLKSDSQTTWIIDIGKFLYLGRIFHYQKSLPFSKLCCNRFDLLPTLSIGYSSSECL